jgi:hypothetical protein
MDLVTCSECGNHLSETTATARPEQARKTHPIMWVAFAAIIPLLVWDAWESLRESKAHTTPSESVRSVHFRSLNQ